MLASVIGPASTTVLLEARFVVGDAAVIDEPDGSFDVVRSEHTLQWLPDPAGAVAEMARVVRPGGSVSLIDADWSTFTIDIGDDDVTTKIRNAMATESRRPPHVGRRLSDLMHAAGLTPQAATTETHRWASWNPDDSPAAGGCFSMRSLADDLVDIDQLTDGERDGFVVAINDAARQGRFSMALTMHAAIATAPSTSVDR